MIDLDGSSCTRFLVGRSVDLTLVNSVHHHKTMEDADWREVIYIVDGRESGTDRGQHVGSYVSRKVAENRVDSTNGISALNWYLVQTVGCLTGRSPCRRGDADAAALRRRWVHQFTDSRKDGGDRLVMVLKLAFEFVELAGQGGVRGQ